MLQKLNLEKLEEFKKYFKELKNFNHNLNPIIQCIWLDETKTEYFEVKDKGFILIWNLEEARYHSMPICNPLYIKEILDSFLTFKKKENLKITLASVDSTNKDTILDLFKDYYKPIENRDGAEYIYLNSSIKTYAGSKLQKKRNYTNKFLKLYGDKYRYKALEKKDKELILDFLSKWVLLNENKESLKNEYKGIERLLNSSFEFKMSGIFIDNKLISFILGSITREDIVQIHVEKGLYEYEGIYPFIYQQFILKEYNDIKYSSREDDVGDLNLRKSKLSFYPEKLISSYILEEK